MVPENLAQKNKILTGSITDMLYFSLVIRAIRAICG
jgi:hypothetical protein